MLLNLLVYFHTALKSRNKTWTLCKSGQAEGAGNQRGLGFRISDFIFYPRRSPFIFCPAWHCQQYWIYTDLEFGRIIEEIFWKQARLLCICWIYYLRFGKQKCWIKISRNKLGAATWCIYFQLSFSRNLSFLSTEIHPSFLSSLLAPALLQNPSNFKLPIHSIV